MQIISNTNLYHIIESIPIFLLILPILLGIVLYRLSKNITYYVGKDNFDRTNQFGIRIYKDYDNYIKTKAKNTLKDKVAKCLRIICIPFIFIPLFIICLRFIFSYM